MEKYGTTKEATGDNKIWRRRCACYMTKGTDTLKYLFLLHGNSCYANAPKCYVIHALPILFILKANKVLISSTAVLTSGSFMLYCMLDAQLLLQPPLGPHREERCDYAKHVIPHLGRCMEPDSV